MNSSAHSGSPDWPRAASVAVESDRLRVGLKDGREVTIPLGWFEWLANATDRQREDFEIIERGAAIWWRELDEGLSVPGFLGLPESPPRPTLSRYVVEYRPEGRVWTAAIPELDSSTRGRTLTEAKRNAREILALLLNVPDLQGAGIEVVDEVQSAEAVEAR